MSYRGDAYLEHIDSLLNVCDLCFCHGPGCNHNTHILLKEVDLSFSAYGCLHLSLVSAISVVPTNSMGVPYQEDFVC
jgi:hypothetical protein